MATPSTGFETVYDNFLSKIDDVEFLNQLQLNVTSMESLMQGYLINSIPRFRRCKQNLDNYDLTAQQFNLILSIDEIDILSDLMLIQYLTPKVNTLQLIRQSISSKDFQLTSQANHLKMVMELKNNTEKSVKQKIVDYTYNFGNINGLSSGGTQS